MHHLYFVLIKKENAKTSKEARLKAQNELINNGFISQEGYFGGGMGDRFVIGGRWNGILDPHNKPFDQQEIPKNTIKKREAQAKWEKQGGTDLHPFFRSPYQTDGYEDDARIFNSELLDHLKSKPLHINDTSVFIPSLFEEHSINTIFKEAEKYLDNYWLVVIDYHT